MFELEMFSATCASVFKSKVVCAEGSNVFQVKSDQLTPGTYFLTIQDITDKNNSRVSFSK